MSPMRRLALLATMTIVVGVLFPMVSAAGGGCHPSPTGEIPQARVDKGARVELAIAECAFDPAVIYTEPGATLTWVNEDPVPHTVSGVNEAWGSQQVLQQADMISFAFKTEGVYPFFCELHPGMVGAVVVGDPDPSDVPLAAAAAVPPPPDKQAIATAVTADSDSSGWPWLIVAASIGAATVLVVQFRRRRAPAGEPVSGARSA